MSDGNIIFFFQDINLSGEHIREGLTCIVSVVVPNPKSGGQTKVHLIVVVFFVSDICLAFLFAAFLLIIYFVT